MYETIYHGILKKDGIKHENDRIGEFKKIFDIYLKLEWFVNSIQFRKHRNWRKNPKWESINDKNDQMDEPTKF